MTLTFFRDCSIQTCLTHFSHTSPSFLLFSYNLMPNTAQNLLPVCLTWCEFREGGDFFQIFILKNFKPTETLQAQYSAQPVMYP